MESILMKIEETAALYPSKEAVVGEGLSYTYEDLLLSAKALASHLVSVNESNKPIALYMSKTPREIVAMLAVLYSGAPYVVLDIASPADRLSVILETLDHPLVVSDQENLAAFQKEKAFDGITSGLICYEDFVKGKIDFQSLQAIRKDASSGDLAYILFTSGSTGKPKGALISHGNVLSYGQWFVDCFHLGQDSRLANQTPFYFSMSVSDIYGTLFSGATLYIIPRLYFSFPAKLIRYLNDNRINTIYWVPSVFALIDYYDLFSFVKPLFLTTVLFAGEVMANKHLNYFRSRVPEAHYANLFGPTETTDICTYYKVNRSFSDGEPLPIGRACEGLEVFLLKDGLVSKSEGEMYVAGPFVGKGYYHNEEKSRECFVKDPRGGKKIVYKTGDLCHYNQYGELMFDGRADFQIKRHGFRIELGEIETAAITNSGLMNVVAIYDQEKEEIVLFYEGKVGEEELRQTLVEKVPPYMMPEHIKQVRRLIYNANGKIDRHYYKDHFLEVLEKGE